MSPARCGIGSALLAWVTLVTPAHADPEHERIAAERAAANARFVEQERACQERFVVTSCVDAARREQQQTLTRLHRAETVLDEAARREAGARRRQSVADRVSAQAARASETPPAPRQGAPRAAPRPNPPAATKAEPADRDARAAQGRRNEARFEERARAAQAHREAVERRNAERKAQGKVAAPLPMPPVASAPR